MYSVTHHYTEKNVRYCNVVVCLNQKLPLKILVNSYLSKLHWSSCIEIHNTIVRIPVLVIEQENTDLNIFPMEMLAGACSKDLGVLRMSNVDCIGGELV